jgi:hypothetical protein
LSHSLLQPPWNWRRTGMIDNIFMLSLGNSRALKDRPTLQMRKITFRDKATPWSRNNHVLGTWLPSQVMIITISLEPWKNKDWDNDQPDPTWPLKHTCDWDCSCIFFVPCPNSLSI